MASSKKHNIKEIKVYLLNYVDDTENQIDELLLIVPDDYEQAQADEMAGEVLHNAKFVGKWEMFQEKAGSDIGASEFRPYIG